MAASKFGERGCVEDQPQQRHQSKRFHTCLRFTFLRLVPLRLPVKFGHYPNS